MFAADGADEADRQAADAIMRTNGSTVWLDDEAQMHAITGISGSGPAYVFYLLNALKEAARRKALMKPPPAAYSLATFKGAVESAGAKRGRFCLVAAKCHLQRRHHARSHRNF